ERETAEKQKRIMDGVEHAVKGKRDIGDEKSRYRADRFQQGIRHQDVEDPDLLVIEQMTVVADCLVGMTDDMAPQLDEAVACQGHGDDAGSPSSMFEPSDPPHHDHARGKDELFSHQPEEAKILVAVSRHGLADHECADHPRL